MARTLTASTHRVEEGESLASLAEQSGFFELTLWEWPSNAGLRSQRVRPTVLAPGDLVVIPALRQKNVSAATDALHVFRRRGIPAVYRLRLMTDGRPVSGAAYSLTVEGQARNGFTDEQGCLKEFIPASARLGVLAVPSMDLRAKLRFGHLDPAGASGGAEKRLSNLGYLQRSANGDPPQQVNDAVRAFQRAQQLPETGECDQRTLAALQAAHDFPH